LKAPDPVTLSNQWVTLRPLSVSEAAQYLEIGSDSDIWRYLAPSPFQAEPDARHWIEDMLDRGNRSGDVTFSVYDNPSGKLAGTSSYLDIRAGHGGLEIGFTWYGKAFQRTHVNTAAKLALFEHAFEILGANRVQLQTDARNDASRKAIARLGATEEGILRQHKIYPDGFVRDSAMFSVTKSEWQEVKDRLGAFLVRR
jgi:RimJ/RimL family protein N-acetyltransferase